MSFLGKTIGKIVGHSASTPNKSTDSFSSTSSTSPSNETSNKQSAQQTKFPSPLQQPSSQLSSIFQRNHQVTFSNQYQQDAELTLTHLKKVFYELLHAKTSQEITQNEKDEKIYSLLPLFIKAFGHASLIDIQKRFSDVGDFCFVCSRLLVNEISKRGHDDLVLVKFFEIKTSDDSTDGSGLLNTVNLLASGPEFLIDIMAKSSLPSRLVMCVYLFICLPEAKDSILDQCEFNAKERRILFQKCFQQLLTKLCQFTCTSDELVDADSMKLLFKVIASNCEQHNIPWRLTAADSLLALTKSFNSKAINYIHQSQCIQTCLQCLDPEELCSANLIEKIELLIITLTFLKETSYLSQTLLDDFKALSGYKIIADVVLKLEKEEHNEARSALKNLFICIDEFTAAGFTEMKPVCTNLNTNMFKIEGFQVPQPAGQGRTVRNTHAFQLLLSIFNKAQTYDLCMLVLDTIRNIYLKDECNYFILESQNLLLYSLDDSSIKIHNKTNEIQVKFLEIFEFIAFNLKFVPCKELVCIGLSIQNYTCTKWSINCANFLLKLVKANVTYKDAFRELGLLEMTVSCLYKFANLLKEKHVDSKDEVQIDSQQKELGFLIMELVSCLLSHNSPNAKLFRELGGARLAHNMVPYKLCRNQSLKIVSSLLITTAGEDDMSTLLGLMHTAQMEDLDLKNSVLKSLLQLLRESHRTRTVFRKAGGFVYVVSVLISMEGSLSVPAKSPWDKVKKSDVFAILSTILSTLTVSMRYEPANAKFFETEVRWKSLCAALKLLGCFDSSRTEFETRVNIDFVKRSYDVFETFFSTLDNKYFESDVKIANHIMNEKLVYICYIMRYLYDTAIDAFDKCDVLLDFCESFDDRSFNRHAKRSFQSNELFQKQMFTSVSDQSENAHNSMLKHSNSMNKLNPISCVSEDPFIVHPGAISSILQLLPAVPIDEDDQMASRLQFHMINLIKNLLRFERNQQLMSNAHFIDDILSTCKCVLNDENHFLNSSIQHIFERLATQSIKTKSLREFIRLGTVFNEIPLTNNTSNLSNTSALIPLNRVKCLISMTTPRDSRQYLGVSFVEFNMLVEGFGCLFLPSIAPQLANSASIVSIGMVSSSQDQSVNGGVGSGERTFPPQSGLTYSTWIFIEKFSSNISASSSSENVSIHPIRVLTLIRHSKLKDTLTSCLAVYLSPNNRSLFVSTEETLLQLQKSDKPEQNIKLNDYTVKFNCSEFFQENKWIHLTLVWSRAVLKQSTVTLFCNSKLIGTQRLHYINSFNMNSNATSLSNNSIHAVIGTLPMFRLQSPCIWRQAACYLFEEIFQPASVSTLYQLGPNYLGSFQSLDLNESVSSLIAEEKIIFGLHAKKAFEMTLSKFKKIYNKNDSKSIGKQLNISSNESVTPIRILSNTATQLSGPARCVGGVIIGYMGVRTFEPTPITQTIEHTGGVSFLLCLIAMANDIEFLYASVKALVCIVKSNQEIAKEMERINGYQLLAMLFKHDSGKEQAIVSNVKAFEYLLCDLEIWYETPVEIQRSLHERFNDLLNDQLVNIRLFQRLNMLKRLLYMIKEPISISLNETTLKCVLSTIKLLIAEHSTNEDLLKFGQYMVSLLPDIGTNEKIIKLESFTFHSSDYNLKKPKFISNISIDENVFMPTKICLQSLAYTINLRNKLMEILNEIVSQNTNNKSINFQEDIQRLLGYDWFLLFMQPNIHRTSQVKACKILFTLLLNPQNLNRFKESTYCGGWLNNLFPHIIQNKLHNSFSEQNSTSSTSSSSATLFNSASRPAFVSNNSFNSTSSPQIDPMNNSSVSLLTHQISNEMNIEICAIPCFQLMQVFFSKSVETVELYYLLFALLFDAQKINELPKDPELDLNSICIYIFDKSFDSEHTLFCKINTDVSLDITIILLNMVRTLMNNTESSTEHADDNEKTKDYSIILLQIFRFMYHNCDEFRQMAYNADFLGSLVLTVYPYQELNTKEQEQPTPVEIKLFAEAIYQNNTKSSYKSYLSIHPARKLVMDFLRDLIYDGLINNTLTSKGFTIVDLILASLLPENTNASNKRRNQEFITELFKTIVDFLSTVDLFNDQHYTQPQQLNVNVNIVLPNFFSIVDRLVDKLWDGTYRRESKEVFEMTVKFMNNIKKKSYNTSYEQLISSMNRVLLYQLSRPSHKLVDQVAMLEVLHKITSLKSIIFAQTNFQSEFFACLTHCLLRITDEDTENLFCLADLDEKGFQSRTQWYVTPKFNSSLNTNIEEKMETSNIEALILAAAQRVWLDVYLSKKSLLEDCLKVQLNSIGKNPTLDQLRPVLYEPAQKCWDSFVENDKRLPTLYTTSQLQAKIQRVTGGFSTMAGGFSRVVSLKKTKKEIIRLNLKELSDAQLTIQANINGMKEYMDSEYRRFFRTYEQQHQYLYEEWIKIEKDLLRERALWGEDTENKLNKWKLDFTEGPNRQRKRLIPNNEDFYKNYHYRPEIELLKPNKKYKIPSSVDSKEYFNQFRVKSFLNYLNDLQLQQQYLQQEQQILSFSDMNNQVSNSNVVSVVEMTEEQKQQQQIKEFDSVVSFKRNKINEKLFSIGDDLLDMNLSSNNLNSDQEQTPTAGISMNSSQISAQNQPTYYQPQSTNNQNVLRLLEEGEKINHIYRCARVQGLDTTEGVFLFGKEHFYVLDGYTLISTKDIVEIDSLKPSAYEPLIPKGSTGTSSTSSMSSNLNNLQSEKSCSKFAYEDIREVHNRRYLLQEIAMEIFSNDGRNYLLVFPRKCRNKIYERLIALTPDLNDSAKQSIAGQRRTINIEQNTGIINSLIGEKSVVQRWERGEISNFQYLMFLNTLAGRSYNDLMQYPVFPWILADYDSDELNLNDPATFRDLSKPMGAQTIDRLKQFEKRYLEWEDPTGETPPYHYGTHYSSAMIVASYLLRLEPFTQIFLRLQGGHFDLADRLFHSIKDNWLSASKNNMADVKELIPEFFYLPDFLVNSNKFELGKKQSGVALNHVVLPKWAKDDAIEFIRVHRMALESDYVSAHLNEWIDLIFGYKQQGMPAVESMNVFHHLFYEGAVNIDEIDDPLRRNAIIGFINNFGQIPKQLFKKPHPVKKINSQFLYSLNSSNLVPISNNTNQQLQESLPNNESNKMQPLIFIHYLNSLKLNLQPIKELRSQIGQILSLDKGLIVAEQNKFLMPPSYQRYIAWGFSDESIKIGYIDYEKSQLTFENIQDGAIFCCCSPDSKVIITAGSSTTVNVWELGKAKQKRLQLKTRLYGHMNTITCMAVSNAYHLLVTGSRDQSCIIWDINRWQFVRQLPNHISAVSCININELTGDIATASSTYLYLWNINGDLLASINTITSNRNHVVLCVCMSQVNEWDNNNVILTGGTDGIIRMWSMGYNQVRDSQPVSTDEKIEETTEKFLSLSVSSFDGQTKLKDCSDNSISYLEDVQNSQEETENQEYTNKKEVNSEENEIKNQSRNSEIEEDFIIVESNLFVKNQIETCTLKPNHKWKRELILRHKLSMHATNDRRDYQETTSVTAISISKDHKTIHVGDSRGRVFSWVCIDNPCKKSVWIKDETIET